MKSQDVCGKPLLQAWSASHRDESETISSEALKATRAACIQHCMRYSGAAKRLADPHFTKRCF